MKFGLKTMIYGIEHWFVASGGRSTDKSKAIRFDSADDAYRVLQRSAVNAVIDVLDDAVSDVENDAEVG